MPARARRYKITDIVVVGAGTAGLPAAIRAKEVEPEAQVAVLESRRYYASSLLMKRFFYIGFPDEEFYKAGVNAGGEPELWETYVDRSRWLHEWLREKGIRPVGDKTWKELQRIHIIEGSNILKTLAKCAVEEKVEILFDHRAIRLVTQPETKRVLGVKVQTDSKELVFKARKAVVLATGGFLRNKRLVREFGPEWIDCASLAPPGHLGDGLIMALDAGAATKNISWAVVPTRSICVNSKQITHMDVVGSIAVDPRGRRFFNEACPRGLFSDLARACLERIPEKVFFLIYDDKIRQMGLSEKYEKPVEYKGGSIKELAMNAGICPEGLEKTINKYNSDLATIGHDTMFGRGTVFWTSSTPPPKIDTPPFYAIKCTPALISCKGGIRINAKAQVLNWFNEVIPSLFSAGEVTGGLFYKGFYIGATMASSAMTFGCIAGENAVKEPISA